MIIPGDIKWGRSWYDVLLLVTHLERFGFVSITHPAIITGPDEVNMCIPIHIHLHSIFIVDCVGVVQCWQSHPAWPSHNNPNHIAPCVHTPLPHLYKHTADIHTYWQPNWSKTTTINNAVSPPRPTLPKTTAFKTHPSAPHTPEVFIHGVPTCLSPINTGLLHFWPSFAILVCIGQDQHIARKLCKRVAQWALFSSFSPPNIVLSCVVSCGTSFGDQVGYCKLGRELKKGLVGTRSLFFRPWPRISKQDISCNLLLSHDMIGSGPVDGEVSHSSDLHTERKSSFSFLAAIVDLIQLHYVVYIIVRISQHSNTHERFAKREKIPTLLTTREIRPPPPSTPLKLSWASHIDLPINTIMTIFTYSHSSILPHILSTSNITGITPILKLFFNKKSNCRNNTPIPKSKNKHHSYRENHPNNTRIYFELKFEHAENLLLIWKKNRILQVTWRVLDGT